MNARPRIEKLRQDHHVDRFDCGQEALNRFLVRYAFQNQQAEASRTYVALVGDEVVGFHTLVVAQVEYDDARASYQWFGFVAAPTDPCHLFVFKDVRTILKQRARAIVSRRQSVRGSSSRASLIAPGVGQHLLALLFLIAFLFPDGPPLAPLARSRWLACSLKPPERSATGGTPTQRYLDRLRVGTDLAVR
jgi:hypothetical protein